MNREVAYPRWWVAALHDADWVICKAAAAALGAIGDPRAVESLLAALRDSDWSVRKTAIAALGGIGDARAIEPLLGSLRADLAVREPVEEALARIGAPAVEPLLAALQR
jgi:HEAT repeat protein